MLSLKDRIELLENDIKAVPPRISVHSDLPFAILRYEPDEEWSLRQQVRLLVTRLNNVGKEVITISLAELLWEAISSTEGIETLIELEQGRGFEAAQEQATIYLSDDDWSPLTNLLTQSLKSLDPKKHLVFLTRAASMAPAIYQMSRLLDEMQGRTRVTVILFYPGTLEGTTGLRFMGLKDREALGNYRVKIYG